MAPSPLRPRLSFQRLGPWCMVLGLVWAAWVDVVGASGGRGEAQHRGREPIAEVRMDADRDARPDRLGDTVSVAGRVTAASGVLVAPNEFALQDSTGGIHVSWSGSTRVDRGDSVHVSGVVAQENGLTILEATRVEVVEAPKRVPSPTPLTVSAAADETYEGHLVRVRGRVTTRGSNNGGDYVILSDRGENGGSSVLTVFVANRHLRRIDFEGLTSGDEVAVTGVLGQYDYEAPYRDYYQIYPREDADLSSVSEGSDYLILPLFILGGVGGLAVIGVLILRAAVKRRTKQLNQSRARFRRLAEATSEGIIIHDDGKVIDANESLAEMVGTKRDDVIGRDVDSVLSDATRNQTEILQNGTAEAPAEAEIQRADGTTIPVAIEEKTVRTDNQRVSVIALRDISKRKEWEREILLAKEEAEQMAQLKSNLLNNMSHELRTPVTSITGYAELLMEDLDGTRQEFAARIRKGAERLSETLKTVLEYAQIESGSLEVNLREVSVAEVVEKTVKDHEWEARDKALSLEMDVCDGCIVRTDPSLLYRILGNLVHNAIKFTDEGYVRVSLKQLEDRIRIEVRDTGIGIDPAFRSQLFDPFAQESRGRSRIYEGAGLGLALTKRMVTLLEGSIDVESTKTEGSTFVVDLPSQTDSAPAASAEKGASPPH